MYVARSRIPLLVLALVGCGRSPAAHEAPVVVAAVSAPEAPLEVFAAASLREVMTDVRDAFTAQGNPGITFNFAGSNVLAQQIAASTRGDVLVSADERWVNELVASGHVDADTRETVASNTLVLVAHPRAPYTLASPEALVALGFRHLALAEPESVPAGRYAKAYLTSLRAREGTVWDAVRARVAPAADVRAALMLAATQEDVIGLVYRTDARAASVRVLYDVPPATLPTPIRYIAVAVRNRPRPELAARLLALLSSAEGQSIFARHGFLPPPAPVAATPR